MRIFDYIPKYHFKDSEKNRVRDNGPLSGEMWIQVQDRWRGYWNQVMLRYCPALPLDEINVEWCRKMAAEAQSLSGHVPLRIEVRPDKLHQIVYLPKENCYRLFVQQSANSWAPILEIKGTAICRDKAKLMARGIHPYMADLDDDNDVFLNPSFAEDGSPGAGLFLNGWEHMIPAPIMKQTCALSEALKKERLSGTIIYPPQEMMFRALILTPPENVKVVILGQDPYHGPDEACGLAFSVQASVRIPPSLRNIYKVLNKDIGCPIPATGDLTKWAERGVLLLNTVLSVEEDKPLSHAKRGWQDFTSAILCACAALPQPVVFLFWGAQAVSFGTPCVEAATDKLILTSTHPSPLAANRGTGKLRSFMESTPFSQANYWLERMGQTPINWSLE